MRKTARSALLLAVCAWSLLAASVAAAGPSDILVVQSYHASMPWTMQCERGIGEALGARYRLHYFYMDTKRLDAPLFQARADAAWAAYEELAPALVMLGDDNALRLLGPRFAATSTPVVYFGINNNPRSYFEVLPRNVTGVLERLPLFPWLRYLRQLMPGARRALILLDSSPTSEAILAVTFKDRRTVLAVGIEARYVVAENWGRWRAEVLSPGEADLIVIPTFHTLRDGAGQYIPVLDAVRWTSAHSAVPVFALQDYAVFDEGAVGSYVVVGEAHGRQAGELALRILDEGLEPKDVRPLITEEGMFFFNEKQLARFGLTLPEALRAHTIYR